MQWSFEVHVQDEWVSSSFPPFFFVPARARDASELTSPLLVCSSFAETSWENLPARIGTNRSSLSPSLSLASDLTSPSLFFPASPSVRQSVLRAFGVPDVPPKRPVVTYISRQGGRRSLRDEDHDALVAGLTAAGEKNNWEIVVARMQYMSKKEQVILSARTTVMIGVHGSEFWSSWALTIEVCGLGIGAGGRREEKRSGGRGGELIFTF